MIDLLNVISDYSKRNALKYLIGTIEEPIKQREVFENVCNIDLSFGYEILDSIYDDFGNLTFLAKCKFSEKHDEFFSLSIGERYGRKIFTDFFVLCLSANESEYCKKLLEKRYTYNFFKKDLKHKYSKSNFTKIFKSFEFRKLSSVGIANLLKVFFDLGCLSFIRFSLGDNLNNIYTSHSQIIDEIIMQAINDNDHENVQNLILSCDCGIKYNQYLLKQLLNGRMDYLCFSNLIDSLNLNDDNKKQSFINSYYNKESQFLFKQYVINHPSFNKKMHSSLIKETSNFTEIFYEFVDFMINNGYFVKTNFKDRVATKDYKYINPNKNVLSHEEKVKFSKILFLHNEYGLLFESRQILKYSYYRKISGFSQILKNIMHRIQNDKELPIKFNNYNATISNIKTLQNSVEKSFKSVLVVLKNIGYIQGFSRIDLLVIPKTTFRRINFSSQFIKSAYYSQFIQLLGETKKVLSYKCDNGVFAKAYSLDDITRSLNTVSKHINSFYAKITNC